MMRSRRVALLLLVVAPLVGWGCPSRPDDPVAACLERAVFRSPEDSPYVLPYRVGSAFPVFQTYCGPFSHGRDGQMSIDFVLPMGSEVLAARAGEVRHVIDQHEDFGREINLVYIEHEDCTSAFYAHLQQHSVAVGVGDPVIAGQLIARSGASGTSLEHLHFGVSSRWPPRRPDDLPVNFRNAKGPLDARGGLQQGVCYEALAY